MILRPDLVYKYKSITTEEKMEQFSEILEERKLYFPRPSELNDPMEANSVSYSLGVVGEGHHKQAGKTHPIIVEIQEEYRILSFTTKPGSSLMWAHYANDYQGCCLIFSTKNVFKSIEPTIYSTNNFHYDARSGRTEELYQAVRDSFLFKNTEWSYENEWRLIQKNDKDRIIFGDDLLGVIVGKNIEKRYRKEIIEICDKKMLPCFSTYIMNGRNCIQFLPIEKETDFHTPCEIYEYMKEKEEQEKCKENEIYLFYEMNDELIRQE